MNKLSIRVCFILVSTSILFLASCGIPEKREFRKYLMVEQQHKGFSILARLDGTLYEGQTKTVATPYSLSLFVTPEENVDVKISNMRLLDSNGVEVINVDSPIIHREELKRDKVGFYYYVKIKSLNIAYVDYRLECDIRYGEEEPLSIKVDFIRNYSETISTDRWDQIMSI